MDKMEQQQLLLEIEKLNKAQVRIKRKTTFMLCVIALLVLITSTMAWFTLNSFASVENIQMDITTGVDLRVDMENHGSDIELYKKEITNEMINSYLSSKSKDALAQQLLDPVTTRDGISFSSENGSARNANEDTFLEFECYFIASKDMWVHLSSDDANDMEGTLVSTTESGLKAEIVQALRLSFEDSGSAAIYEPNKTTAVNGQTTFDLQTPMVYSNDTRLFHLDELQPKKVTIRLWAEGNDPQCDNDVQDANLTVRLLFSGTDENNVSFG
ncbi:MAG: hypothetical protein E7513_01745 [Ruminococcaceae bacterium]|nr:hypothetical protein [Oscillospiraceae bacterium]